MGTGPEKLPWWTMVFVCRARLTTGRWKFEEFAQRLNQVVYVSRHPGEYERTRSGQVVEQVIRPTGLLD